MVSSSRLAMKAKRRSRASAYHSTNRRAGHSEQQTAVQVQGFQEYLDVLEGFELSASQPQLAHQDYCRRVGLLQVGQRRFTLVHQPFVEHMRNRAQLLLQPSHLFAHFAPVAVEQLLQLWFAGNGRYKGHQQ